MTLHLGLADPGADRDLVTMLQRAVRVEQGAARILVVGSTLAVWVRVLAPAGLLDATPTVLGMRAARLAHPVDALDAVVPIADALAVQGRADGETSPEFAVPAARAAAAWTGITPPMAGWAEVGRFGAAGISALVERGTAEVAASAPPDAGAPVITKVRGIIWGRPAAELGGLPAGAGFALAALGFLGADGSVRHLESAGWHRLSTGAGEVLVRPGRGAR